MVFDLSPGDVVRIGDGVILKVLAVEDDLIRFGLESPEGCPLYLSAQRLHVPEVDDDMRS